MPLILREDIGRRLTIPEMDGNFIYLENLAGGSATTLTNTEAIDLINSAGIKSGTNYLIIDVNPTLYGSNSAFTYGLTGTNIILKGLDSTHFSSNGHGQFYNPIYASYSMWDTNASYLINDKVIFGGQVWVNTTGNTGDTLGDGYDSASFISLDPEDWAVQPYTDSTLYNCVWDEVEYDLQNDFITSRYEAFNNNLVNNASKTFWFYCEINPIQSFKWGSFNEFGPTVADCRVVDSYFGCLNTISGNISSVELTNFSWIYNMTLINSSNMFNIKISNNSGINSFTLDTSGELGDITIDNNSTMYDFNNYSGSINYINISNYSSMYSFGIDDGGDIIKVSLTNQSQMNYFTLWDSDCFIEWIDLSFGRISSFDIYSGSYMEEINITNDCEISNFNLDNNSYFSCITLEGDSYMENINLYNYSYFENISIKHGSGIYGVLLCDDSGSECYISEVEITNHSYLTDDDDSIYLNDGGYMTGIKIDNYSEITNVAMYGDSYTPYMQNIILSNGSIIDNIYINADSYPSYISKLTIVSSGFESIQLNNSYMEYINVSSGLMDNLYLTNNSYIEYIEVLNGAISSSNWITENSDAIYLDNSYISAVTVQQSEISGYMLLTNNSHLRNIHLTNYSTLCGGYRYYGDSVNNVGEYNYTISLNNSGIDTLTLTNNSIFGLGAIGLTNASYLSNITLNNSSKISGYIASDNGTIANLTLDNESRFGRGNDESEGCSDSIELHSASSIRDVTLTNSAIIDGYIHIQNSHILDITLSGIPDWNDSISPGNGNDYGFDNETGIVFGGGMQLYDSNLQDIEISNGSYMTGLYGNEIYLENNSYMQCIKANNGSIINDIYLNSSFMKNIEVLNGSYIYNIEVLNDSSITYLSVSNFSFFGDYIYLSDASYMTFIKIDNNSELFGGDYGNYNINLYSNSYMQNINILNHSNMTGFTFDDGGAGYSYFEEITLENYSYMYAIELYNGSYLKNIKLTNNSGIDGIYLCDDSGSNAYLYNIKLSNDSYITDDDDYIYIEDGGYIANIDMNNNSYFSGYLELYNGSYINSVKIENSSYFGYGMYLWNSSQITNLSINNDSYIEGYILMDGSVFDYINMVNNSWISGHSEFYGSYLYNIELTNYSKMYDEILTNSAIGQLSINNNSKMYGNTMDGYSAIEYTTINNHSEVHNNNILNGSVFEYLTLDNESYLFSNMLDSSSIEWLHTDDCNIYNNNFYNDSGIYDSTLSNSYIESISMKFSSYIADTQMSDSGIQNINMYDSSISDNFIKNSSIYSIGITNSGINGCQLYSSDIYYTTLYNNSSIQSVMLKSSYIENITSNRGQLSNLELNDSSIYNSVISNSGIYEASLKSSNINNIDLLNYGMEFIFMRDSTFINYNTHTDSVVNLDMLGTTFNFGNNNLYVVPYYTNANTNTIKYQFSVQFNGTTGYGEVGAVNIPFVCIPTTGWYIERVIVDNNGTGAALVASGPGVYLNIGNNVDSDTGLDNTKGDVSLLASKITYSDIANGGADGTKTNSIGNLTMNIEGGNITSGIILVEVILKNTNYGTNND